MGSQHGRGMMENRWTRMILAGAMLGMTFGPAAAAMADEPDNAALKAEIEVLKNRLASLENKLDRQSAMSTAPTAIGEKPAGGGIELPSGLAGLQMSGYVDSSYIYNFNKIDPGANSGQTNRGRVFDTNNGFTIQAAKLTLEKPVSDDELIGFRTDMMFGDDAEVIHSTGLGGGGTPTDSFDLEQAYAVLRAPVGNGLDFKVGKFVTLLGAEVIESPSNWNFSRSFLFGYAIPFTHTGALATYSFGDMGSTTIGLVNGWDIVDENNNFKTMIGNITLTPVSGVSLGINGITGAERTSDNRNDRSVIDLVASWTPIEKLSLMANYDYGHESSMTTGTTATTGFDTADWHGVALYAKYDFDDKWSLAGRTEWFNDLGNTRTGFTGPSGGTIQNDHFWEWTATLQRKIHEHVLARLEFRHDQASEHVFLEQGGGKTNSQDTIATEVIYHF